MSNYLDTSSTEIHLQKPDTIDSPIYAKPNAYDEIIYDRPHEKDDATTKTGAIQTVVEVSVDEEEPVSTTEGSLRSNGSDSETYITASVLSSSSIAPMATTISDEHGTFSQGHLSYASSLISPSPSTSASSLDSSMQQLILSSLESSKQSWAALKNKEDAIVYDLRKRSITKPQQVDIYLHSTKALVYRKEQSHSYSWGFQNLLYKQRVGGAEEKDENTKVAESRRKAFQKDIVVECGGAEYQLMHRNKTHVLFVYETKCEGLWVRWKRPSLLSHDMVCELAPPVQQIPGEKHKRRNWKLLAYFDSKRMGYFVDIGKLHIDHIALQLFEDQASMEAHMVVTCCTLIDLMREVVEKAVGLGEGGVAGSTN
ncbi:hypothetical protein BX666DRAFT_1866550 [Dichotomocladium elegans]|nr:hypothetical protein BX666DRAFT_1866550 [Dichotomocladium elegans]